MCHSHDTQVASGNATKVIHRKPLCKQRLTGFSYHFLSLDTLCQWTLDCDFFAARFNLKWQGGSILNMSCSHNFETGCWSRYIMFTQKFPVLILSLSALITIKNIPSGQYYECEKGCFILSASFNPKKSLLKWIFHALHEAAKRKLNCCHFKCSAAVNQWKSSTGFLLQII